MMFVWHKQASEKKIKLSDIWGPKIFSAYENTYVYV